MAFFGRTMLFSVVVVLLQVFFFLLHSVAGFNVRLQPITSGTGRNAILKMNSIKQIDVLQNGMQFRNLPNSDLLVSELGLGTMNFGDQITKRNAFTLLDHAIKKYGINFIDTAETYPTPSAPSTHGRSESIIGEWLKSSKDVKREDIVIATSICGFSDDITWCRGKGGVGTRLNPKQIAEAVDAQLRRLGTDHIDLLQFHWPDRYVPLNGASYTPALERIDATPIVEQLEAVGKLIKAGKVRSFGLSNETPYGVADFVRTAELLGDSSLPRAVSLQNPYNLLEQNDFNMGLLEACSPINGNLGVLAASPLAGGALTGKYLDLDSAPQTARMRKYIGYMYRYVAGPAKTAVQDYSEVAAAYDLPLGAVSLAWVYSQPWVTSTLLGVTSTEQLRENVQALNLAPLGADLVKALHEVTTKKGHIDPTKGKFDVIDPSLEYIDPSTLPWGAKDQDVDPELDILINQRLN